MTQQNTADEGPEDAAAPQEQNPLPLAIPSHRPAVIDTVRDYHAAIDSLAIGTGPVAVDAERASGFRYSQRAYLIQLFRRDAGTFLFDPPALRDFSDLAGVIADEEWVFHAASQDLPSLREVGLDPHRIFDTELGARLAGLPRVGLATVVESLLGLRLAKAHSAADWSTRPLPQPWLDYAALDVELLIDLRDEVDGLLTEAGKAEIARQEFDAVLSRPAKDAPIEPWRRLSGLHSIRSPRSLAVARELWLARDVYAQEVDTAPGRLVPDSSLIAAAKSLPESRGALSALREFTGRASRSQLGRWWDAIERGLATDDLPARRAPSGDALPPPRAWSERNPEADARLRLARESLAGAAESLAVPLENLLTPDHLRRLAWEPPESLSVEAIRSALDELGARPWQLDATAQAIHDAFVEARQQLTDPETPSS